MISNQELLSQEDILNTNILIVDDAKLSHHVLQQLLNASGFTKIHQLSQAKDVRNYLIQHPIDVIILDWMMPVIDGISLTRLIRGLDQKLNRNTGIIMVTGKDSPQAMRDAFDNGVDDFIGKSSVNIQLIPRLEHIIRKKNEVSVLKAKQQSLKKMIIDQRTLITRDPVSKLPVMAEAKEYFNNLVKHNLARQLSTSAVHICLKNYKLLKQDNAAKTVQQLIESFSQKVKKLIRPTDFLARIQPDELLILLTHQDQEPLKSTERMTKALDAFSIYTSEGFKTLEIDVTCVLLDLEKASNHNTFDNFVDFLHQTSKTKMSKVDRLRLHWPKGDELDDETIEQLVFDV